MNSLLEYVDLEVIGTKIVEYIPNIIGAILILVLFWGLSILIGKVSTTGFSRRRIPHDAQALLLRFIRYALIVIGALTVAGQLGINVTSMIAGLGIAGLALSFAAQDTVTNLISGVAIMIDRPFKQGDWISLGDMHASVTDIRLRTTVLTTFDNETVVVPNKQLTQERVVNYTLTPRIRIRVPIGIAYKENIEAARQIMLVQVEGDELILNEPAPTVLVSSLGDSSVNLELRFWTEEPSQKFPLTWKYTEKCKVALDDAGIQIPFPHMQIFLEKSEGLKELTAKQPQQ